LNFRFDGFLGTAKNQAARLDGFTPASPVNWSPVMQEALIHVCSQHLDPRPTAITSAARGLRGLNEVP
jgi:hypothetical protein